MIVEYCPTDNMISYVLTKPLQGAAFRKFRALLLNLPNDLNLEPSSSHRSVLNNTHRDSVTDTDAITNEMNTK